MTSGRGNKRHRYDVFEGYQWPVGDRGADEQGACKGLNAYAEGSLRALHLLEGSVT
jgi:hypothetical protein